MSCVWFLFRISYAIHLHVIKIKSLRNIPLHQSERVFSFGVTSTRASEYDFLCIYYIQSLYVLFTWVLYCVLYDRVWYCTRLLKGTQTFGWCSSIIILTRIKCLLWIPVERKTRNIHDDDDAPSMRGSLILITRSHTELHKRPQAEAESGTCRVRGFTLWC